MAVTNQLTDYSFEWPAKYEAERAAIQKVIGKYIITYHHIGSTAISGMRAKPEIDILLVVENRDNIEAINVGMVSLGYRVRGDCGIPGRDYFSKDINGVRTHKAHVIINGLPSIVNYLAFRDYLIKHPVLAAEYSALKERLVKENTTGMKQYCDGKDSFVAKVLTLSKQEGYF